MTISLIILLVIAVAVGFFIWRANQARTGGRDLPSTAPRRIGSDEPRIENVEAGGVIRLTGIGPELADHDVQVVARHSYQEGSFRWFELEGDTGTSKLWVTVEDDDELEVSISLEKLRASELGVSFSQLEAIEERDEGEITYAGESFEFEECGHAMFYRDGDQSQGEAFRYWEFESESSGWMLTFEAWSDDSVEAHLSQMIRLSQITVYAVREVS